MSSDGSCPRSSVVVRCDEDIVDDLTLVLDGRVLLVVVVDAVARVVVLLALDVDVEVRVLVVLDGL
jgi:hypothetical protein